MGKQSWRELSSIQLGGAICLPVILIGHELVRTAGLGAALAAIIAGNALLFGLALIASMMSVDCQKTTAENAEDYFGAMGKRFFAMIIVLSLSAWFAIQTQVMSRDLASLMGIVGIELDTLLPLNIVLGLIMVGSSFFGLQGVTLLANATLPLMVITLGVAVFSAGATSPHSLSSTTLATCTSSGLSLIIAAAISAVVDLPTFFRHAKSKKDALIASGGIFLIGIPLVELVGVLLGFWSNSSSLTEALLCVDVPLLRIWVGLFILFAGWTTNNTNVYSATMSLQSVFPQLSEKKGGIIVGIICCLLSCFPLLEKLSLVLDVMGVCIASMGGVVLTAYSLRKFFSDSILHSGCQKAAWVIGASAGLFNIFLGGLFSNVSIIDAMMSASCSLIVLRASAVIKKRGEPVYEISDE